MAKVAVRENILVVELQRAERAVCCRTLASSTSFYKSSRRLVCGVYWRAVNMIGCAARPVDVLSKAQPGRPVSSAKRSVLNSEPELRQGKAESMGY